MLPPAETKTRNKIQNDLDSMEKWAGKNRMNNGSKCQVHFLKTPYFKKERVKNREMQMNRGLETLSHKKRRSEVGIFSLGGKKSYITFLLDFHDTQLLYVEARAVSSFGSIFPINCLS